MKKQKRQPKCATPFIPPKSVWRKHGGSIELLVEWDNTSQGARHYVDPEELLSTVPLAGGVRVTFPYGNEIWTGEVAIR